MGLKFGGPSQPFNPDNAVAAPDYNLDENWVALPGRKGLEDVTPKGIEAEFEQGASPVDVFFILPTAYTIGETWTSPMDTRSVTEENIQWMMANQASVFNGCCNIYAPRYRDAHVLAFMDHTNLNEQAIAFAYQDVERAFDYFLANYSNARPFIVAGHSQGTRHGVRLLKERIGGTPLADRLVAAYLIGNKISVAQFEEVQDIPLCDSPSQTHCAIHWDTWSDQDIAEVPPERIGNACVNPLSWHVDGAYVERDRHLGAVKTSGEFGFTLSGDDRARGTVFEPLTAPAPKLLSAQCKDGRLFIPDQKNGLLFNAEVASTANYHGLDYPAFHIDIRENANGALLPTW